MKGLSRNSKLYYEKLSKQILPLVSHHKNSRIVVPNSPLGDPGNHSKPLSSLRHLDLHLFYYWIILLEIFTATIIIKMFY
jgi:hypothetical protein